MTYEEQHELDVKKLQNERQEASDWGELSNFYRRHRDVIACQANSKLILQYFAGDPLTPATLDDALNHPRLRVQLAFQTTEEDRFKIEEKILALISGGTSPDAIEHAKTAFKYKSTEELRAQLETLQQRKELQSKSVEELRTLVKGEPQSRFKPVPQIYRTRSMLLSLASENISEFRKLAQRCGSQALNEILNRREIGE